MSRHLLIIDFETVWDQDFTLKKMTPAEYILDRRFEVLMAAVKVDGGPHSIVEGTDFPRWLSQFDPKDTITITFNSLFDNAILAWHYGFVPGHMIDAMGMARALDGHRFKRFSLAHIADRLGFPAKGDEVANTKGKRREDFSPEEWQAFKSYALRDNEICEMIFEHYRKQMPLSEFQLMDMVLRACVEPKFLANITLLEGHVDDLILRDAELQERANNIDRKHLLSTVKFRQALIDAGFPEDEIEEKPSPTNPEKRVPAFSKTDAFMEHLQNHPDPYIAALATARIGARSRLEETRARTLLRIGRLPWGNDENKMPIPLRYGGAHTHRLSGDWKMNMQNLPRGSKLRYALEAPRGHSVLTIDLGQIEARLVAWACAEMRLLEEFTKYDDGDKSYDPYNRLGSAIFGRPVNRKSSDPGEAAMGFVGKTGILGLGYGCGRDKFHTMVVQGARQFKISLDAIGYTKETADNAVTVYRTRYQTICQGWQTLQRHLKTTLARQNGSEVFGPCFIFPNEIHLPNGMKLHYPDIEEQEVDVDWKGNGQPETRTEYTYRYQGIPYRIYGPKLLENICQALGRVIVMDAALRIKKETGYSFAHQAHDELVYILPDAELAALKQIIHKSMTTSPAWGPDLPLVADVGVGKSYGECK